MTTRSAHDAYLARLASEYEERGYEVRIKPAVDDALAGILGTYRPDLIAWGRGETVAVEVTTRDQLRRMPWLSELADRIGAAPGWRFEIALFDERAAYEQAEPLSALDVRAQIDQADELLRAGHAVPALLVAWSALEAALRTVLQHSGAEPKGISASLLVEQATHEGLVADDDRSLVRRVATVRNAVAHGFRSPATGDEVRQITALARRVLDEADAAVAS